ncbi:hypothetical protein POTOM_059398 [Populus tomentosa]|uniref:Uncharacterized protein n=1 Tax=Populus tomentosa TaxID=118781 RepID=A0A8X7XW08_POPTO|nr:hypothetical protein POTOM_059398 [Populus tomentosa]
MGRSPCCEKAHTNKGAWTKEEDERLIDYIRVHGEGCWRSLPKAAGLLRCGKSCRLRWINYLRPDLKRGNFTEEEDEIIIKLHSLLGNNLYSSFKPKKIETASLEENNCTSCSTTTDEEQQQKRESHHDQDINLDLTIGLAPTTKGESTHTSSSNSAESRLEQPVSSCQFFGSVSTRPVCLCWQSGAARWESCRDCQSRTLPFSTSSPDPVIIKAIKEDDVKLPPYRGM